MNISYGIKNFRVFDSKGTSFSFKPITILTGANCAGKSSLVKSLLLLKNYFDEPSGKSFRPERKPLSFSDETVYINGIDKARNNRSQGDCNVSFSIGTKGLSDNVEYWMDLFFSSKESDPLNNGWLNRIRFSCIIEGNSDVFIDIRFTPDGSWNFDTFNLAGNIYRDFKRNLEIASYRKAFENYKGDADYGLFDQNHPTPEDISQVDHHLDMLIKKIKDNPLNNTLDLSFKAVYGRDYIYSSNYQRECDIPYLHGLRTQGLSGDAYKAFCESDILLFLPIIRTIGDLSPDGFKAYLESQKNYNGQCLSMYEQRLLDPDNGQESINDLLDIVADAFSESGASTFSEYYRELETQALANIGELSAKKLLGRLSHFTNWRDEYISSLSSNEEEGFVNTVEHVMTMLVQLGDLDVGLFQIFDFTTLFDKNHLDFYQVYRVLSYLERKQDMTDQITWLEDPLWAHYEYKGHNGIIWKDPIVSTDYNVEYPEPLGLVEYKRFISSLLHSFFDSFGINQINNVGSFLCPTLRSYSFFDKSNPLSTILLEYVTAVTALKSKQHKRFTPGSFINKWIKETGIGRSVSIVPNEDLTAISIYIIGKNGAKHSSADYGHGVTQLLSILINIETIIIKDNLTPLRHQSTSPVTICFEEPEVSLHPSWQSKLAHIFRDAYETYNIHFIIETHSEYLTRATQAMVAQECITESDLKKFPYTVYYMERDGSAYDMEYQLSGRFKKSFGSGFFDEASKSSLQILLREKKMKNGKNV